MKSIMLKSGAMVCAEVPEYFFKSFNCQLDFCELEGCQSNFAPMFAPDASKRDPSLIETAHSEYTLYPVTPGSRPRQIKRKW